MNQLITLDARMNMTQQVLSNPEMLRQALDNPLFQSMTSNPELMRSIMLSNPEMQQLMEVNFLFNAHIFFQPVQPMIFYLADS